MHLVHGGRRESGLASGTAYVSDLYNSKPAHYVLKPRYPDGLFIPDALAGESVR